ncbi:MAG: alanine racemase [Pseudomonadales bacterium]
MKTRALINTAAFAHNLTSIRQLVPNSLTLAIVKADAYGHGAVGLLPAVTQHSDALAVARLEEAKVLRTAGYQGRLMLMCGVSNSAELSEGLRCTWILLCTIPRIYYCSPLIIKQHIKQTFG